MKLHGDERIDTLFKNQIKVIQSPSVFSYSIDSVLLSNFVNLASSKTIFDLCAGNGAVGLFATRGTKAKIIQVEIQERLADMGNRSIELNHLENQVEMHVMDLMDAPKRFGHDVAETVLVNPPYFKELDSSKKNKNQHYAIARHEISANLDQIVKTSSILLKTKGKLGMVHRPDRFIDVVESFQKFNITPKRLQLVYPKMGREANLILIEGIKNGGKDGMRFLPPLIVHEENGEYTKELLEIYYGS
jgi:putative endonuclease